MEGPADDVTVRSANRKCSALTGSARKTKDNAADWHNLMIKWDKLSEEGFNMAANIANLRRTQSDQLQAGTPPPGAGAAELQHECSGLQDVIDKMAAVLTKMKRLVTSQRGVRELEEFQFGGEGRKVPLFHSWTTKQFEDSSCVLLEAFGQELRLKQAILQELAHTTTSDLCMVYLTCWLHQPFIPPQARLTLEALLLETGHRLL
ncbi:cyclin-dependent kinase 2-interacting protein [Parambassis ranga]|uniref:Cyclin-dependent kinase 2-interacting protein n=1 Tax=Parambassis ranga TaxID=210632 RepID=A0A6P7H5U1_9TELE|nr:cyclin-dependent kinase 2-interacting protein [Parambassis ranga]